MRWSRGRAEGQERQQVRSCHVYEIGGRLLVRVVDMSDGLGIERDGVSALDGFPGVDTAVIGRAVIEAMDQTREIPRPESWRTRGEHAAPLLAASPDRFSSYRSWQRAARQVSVHALSDGIRVTRWHPDLSNGSWMPASDVGRPVDDWPQEIKLAATASAVKIGFAVSEVLRQPPLRDVE